MAKAQNGKPTSNGTGPFTEFTAFVSECSSITQALEKATKRVEQAEATVAESRLKLADSEAEALLEGDGLNEEDSPQAQAFIAASLALERTKAALGGLKKRQRDRDIDLLSLSEKLPAAREFYNEAAIEHWRKETFKPAAKEWARVLRQADALRDALGTIIDVAVLPGEWVEDDDAKTLNEAHCEGKHIAEALSVFRRDAAHRVMVAEQNYRRRGSFDPSAEYKVIRPFTCYGREFAVGDTVDGNKIHRELLGKLYDSKRLAIAEKQEEWSL